MTPESIAGFKIPEAQAKGLRVALANAAESPVALLAHRARRRRASHPEPVRPNSRRAA